MVLLQRGIVGAFVLLALLSSFYSLLLLACCEIIIQLGPTFNTHLYSFIPKYPKS